MKPLLLIGSLVGVLLGALNISQPPVVYQYIGDATTTQVKNGQGFLQTVSINSPGGAPCSATLYDNTAASGSKIAVVDCSGQPRQLDYGVNFTNGLTVVTAASGVPPDVTILYR